MEELRHTQQQVLAIAAGNGDKKAGKALEKQIKEQTHREQARSRPASASIPLLEKVNDVTRQES